MTVFKFVLQVFQVRKVIGQNKGTIYAMKVLKKVSGYFGVCNTV